jgi:hypothetical protein
MPKWADFKKVLTQLRKPQAKEMYDTIVIDTATWAYDLCEKYICQRENINICHLIFLLSYECPR